MIRIHHATAKKAAAKSIELVSQEDGVHATLAINGAQYEFLGYDPKALLDAAAAARTFMESYPGLQVSQSDDVFSVTIPLADGSRLESDAAVADLRDVLAALVEQIDDETAAEMERALEEAEEENDRGSVVPAKYKEMYRQRAEEQGHSPDNCGDWLALQLEGLVKRPVIEGKKALRVDPEAMLHLCLANGCDVQDMFEKAAASGTRGWQGRFRMSAGIRLRAVVATNGKLVVPGSVDRVPPADWVAANKPKPQTEKPKKAAGC